jgi:hypothetical protein
VKGSEILLTPDFPHGTKAGYDRGCKGGSCPAVIPCRDVRRRYLSDVDFRRLIDAGVSLEEIVSIDQAAAERDALVERNRRRAEQGRPPITVAMADSDAARSETAARRPKPVPEVEAHVAAIKEPSSKPQPEAVDAEVLTDETEETGVLVVTITPDVSGLRPRKWAVRKVWVAIAPDGSLHGPFDSDQEGLTFVSAQFPIPLSTLALDEIPAAGGRVRRPWTDADTEQAKDLWAAGHSDSEIGRQMGRDQATVGRRLRRLGFGMNPARRGKSAR